MIQIKPRDFNLDRGSEGEESGSIELVLQAGYGLQSLAKRRHGFGFGLRSGAWLKTDTHLTPVFTAVIRIRIHPVSRPGDSETACD